MVQTQNISQHAAAAKAIRAELKTSFPNTKFKIRSESFSMGNAVRIKWTDGPTASSVDQVIRKYQYGHFDGMTDMYEYSNGIDGLPQVKYISSRREYSDLTRESARAEICQKYGRDLFGDNDYLDWFEEGVYGSNAIYRHLSKKSL